MRHGHGHRKLNRTSEHRKALFQNMVNSLIKHEQIQTTVPKAKELKSIIDKVITIGKKNTLAAKKTLFSKLQDKNSVTKLQLFCQKDMRKEMVVIESCKIWFSFWRQCSNCFIELVDKDFNAKGQDSGPVQKKADNEIFRDQKNLK